MPRTNLRDKIVLLTGAAGGIGRACARELAERGARLLLADADAAGLAQTRTLLRERGVEAVCITADLRRLDAVDRLADEALAHAGRIDVLYNNAGVMVASPVLDMEWSDYEELAAVNLWAPLRLTHRLLPGMLERGSGHIAVTASLNGLVTAPGTAGYGLTKAGLIAWHEALRAELRGRGIGVTVVCPGFVRTGLFEHGRTRDLRFLERTRSAPAFVGLQPEKVARLSVRAIERGRPVVHLGMERGTLWLKHFSVRAYDAYNALLARHTLTGR
jgi:dehydrogenase/reductase SDR family protein 7B